MKEREIYSPVRALSPIIVRLDGRAFHRFTLDQQFDRPFDKCFTDSMAEVTAALLKESGFSPLFGYTFSDEISLFFPKSPYDGRIEKIDSVLASFAASALTIILKLTRPVAFDSRVIPVTMDHVVTYLCWRQGEAWRNHINGWSQALLLKEGINPTEVAKMLDGIPSGNLHEICYKRGINLALTPAWQRRGIMVYRKEIEKEGYNPVKKEVTSTIRRVVTIDRDLPLFSRPAGEIFIKNILRDNI